FGRVTFEDILERTQAQLAERHLPPDLGEELLRNGHLLCLPVRGPHDARTALFLGTLLADELVNERFPVYQDSDQFFQHLTAIEGGDDGILPLPHAFIDGVPEWAAMPLLHLGDVGWDLVGVWATDGLSGATESVEGIDSVLARRTWETAIARTKH